MLIWVIADLRKGEVPSAVVEMTSLAHALAAHCEGARVRLIAFAGKADDEQTQLVGRFGADEVSWLCNDRFDQAGYETFANVVVGMAEDGAPDVMLLADGPFGRDVASFFAAKKDVPYVSDVVAMELLDTALVVKREPYFDKVIETLTYPVGSTRLVFTIRPKTQEAVEVSPDAAPPVSCQMVKTPEDLALTILETTHLTSDRPALSEADYVVAGGRGVGGKEGFALLEELADVLGAAVGGTRPTVDGGWIDRHLQIGQTGKSIAPKVYFALGISGSIQHVAGVLASRCIVAVNEDPEADIFKVADYGIVGDLFDVVPKLIESLKENR